MRFVFLTLGYHPDIDGGAYRYAAEVAEVLAARGHEVHAAGKNPDNRLPDQEVRGGVRLHRLRGPGGGFRGNWHGVVDAACATLAGLEADRPDTLVLSHHAYFERALRGRRHAVFFHGPWGLEHRFACRSRPRPLPVRLRDALVAGWLHRVEARALGAAGRLFVASQYVAGRLRKWHPGVRIPAEVVGGGANLARFREVADRAAVRAKFGAAPGETVFLAVRRLDPRMGLGLLIEAFASVASAHPGARLWITGRGAQREELGRLAERLGVAETIRFLGFVPEPDLPDLYAAADLAVMPSLDLEGFGLVTAEALACGTPVLASRAGANAEVVGPLADGLLFASGSATALAAKLDDALSGRLVPPPRAECAAHARREFRWDRAADAFERAWTERRGAAR